MIQLPSGHQPNDRVFFCFENQKMIQAEVIGVHFYGSNSGDNTGKVKYDLDLIAQLPSYISGDQSLEYRTRIYNVDSAFVSSVGAINDDIYGGTNRQDVTPVEKVREKFWGKNDERAI